MFSVASALILIWFTGPMAKLAQLVAPATPPDDTKRAGDSLYLDDTFLTVPSMALQHAQIELTRLGEQVLDIVRKGASVAVNGRIDDIAALLDQDGKTDRLSTSILHYIGRLSHQEHSSRRAVRCSSWRRSITNLEGINEVVTTKLTSVGQQRLAEGLDLARFRNEHTARFAEAVIRNLEQAIDPIRQPNAEKAIQVVAAKPEIEALAASARNSLLERLKLDDKSDVLSCRLASDIIMQFREVAHFARTISRTTQDLQTMVEPNEQKESQPQEI